MPTYKSYQEQSMHYFMRQHDGPASSTIESPAAWYGPDVLKSDAWRQRLTEEQAAEVEAALATAKATGKPTGELTAEDFPLPTLANDIATWRSEIIQGRGFQVVSGLPVHKWSDEDAGIVFWCIGLHMGSPGAQNPQDDLLGHVTDTGDDATDPYVRLYRTSAHIAYHCDAADVVGLLCLRPAKSGGASRIVSSVTVYNEVAKRRPDLIQRMYDPFYLDIRNEGDEQGIRYLPVPPCRYADGRLKTFFHSDYFRSAQRHEDVPDFTDDERTLLDLYEGVASDPALYLDMDLEPGDIQWLSNHTNLHSRTEYEDHDDPAKKRHLLRLWLSIE